MDYNKDLKERHSSKIFQKAGMYEWETPKELFTELNDEFHFDIDVCAAEENAKCPVYYSEKDNAFNFRQCYCNFY